jgi:hypothetical protein
LAGLGSAAAVVSAAVSTTVSAAGASVVGAGVSVAATSVDIMLDDGEREEEESAGCLPELRAVRGGG